MVKESRSLRNKDGLTLNKRPFLIYDRKPVLKNKRGAYSNTYGKSIRQCDKKMTYTKRSYNQAMN